MEARECETDSNKKRGNARTGTFETLERTYVNAARHLKDQKRRMGKMGTKKTNLKNQKEEKKMRNKKSKSLGKFYFLF